MIDVDLVTRKLLLVLNDLEALRPIAAKDLAAYLAAPLDEIVAERYLERMIGRMIDINYHVMTESGHPPPPDYHASFTRLVDLGVLEREFAVRIASCAGLRNRIVHEYNELDAAKVHQALQTAIADIPMYATRVRDYIGRLSE
jgi:uncharacterized protein YutE (UPF0331/DUF86 family)